MRSIKLSVTTAAGGTGTSNLVAVPGGGILYAVQLVDGTFDDGVDVTITAEQDDLSIPLLTKADFNTDQMVYPRVACALNTDGTALTWYDAPIVIGRVKVAIAQGGNTKTGSFYLYIKDL